MISIEEIRIRIGKNADGDWDEEKRYRGFDMSGYGIGDNRSPEGNLENRLKNFNFLKELFSQEFKELIFQKFNLHCWKGNIAWRYDDAWSIAIKEFNGECTEDIILWILQHEDLWFHDFEVPRIITQKQRFDTLKRQGWKCNNCGCALKYSKNHQYEAEVGHIDHIHPYSKRDTYSNGMRNINEDLNLQALCPDCNLKKSKKEIN